MQTTISFKKKLLAVAIAPYAFVGLTQQAIAEEEKSAANIVEEIVVTATKRTTSLQSTPLAISAVTSESLKENNVTSVTDLVGTVPSLEFRTAADHAAPIVFIRGLGTADQTEAGDSGVAFYVDGVVAGRAQGATVMAFDLDRVEVLRGPQGTLFGRNSTGGAISMVTAKPLLGEFAATGETVLGSDSRLGTNVMLNMPFTDTWSLRIASATENKDGTTKNTGRYAPASDTAALGSRTFASYENYGTVDLNAYRISSLMKPTENFSWYLGYENFKNQGTGDVPSLDFEDRKNAATAPGHIDLDSKNIRTRLDYTFGSSDITLTYIGGDASFDQSQLYGDQYGNLEQTLWSTYAGTQHELQLANGDQNRFRWTLGAFSFKEENGIRFDIPHNSGWGSGVTQSQDDTNRLSTFIQPKRSTNSESFYGQGTFDLTDSFRLTAGVRYSDDDREDVGGRSVDCNFVPSDLDAQKIYPDARFIPAGTKGCYNRQYNDMKWAGAKTTYLARAEWDALDDVMLFVSNGNGWKGGVVQDGQGWSAVAVTPDNPNSELDLSSNNALVQKPEQVSNTEFGMKGQFGRLTLNTNLFYMEFTDMQVTSTVVNRTTNQATLQKTNAGSATIQGLEAEATLLVGDAGTMTASMSLLDAKYDELNTSDATFNSVQGQQWNPCADGKDANGGCVNGSFNVAGNTLPYAPEISFSLGYKHVFDLTSGGSIVPRLRVNYSSEYFFDPTNHDNRAAGTLDSNDPGLQELNQPSYAKVDLGVTYNAPNDQWSADFFVNNATNEAIKNNAGANAGYQVAYVWADARAYGLRLNYKFK